MKFWILLTLICTTHVSIAATCSATDESSSFTDLIKLAGDGIAASDELILPLIDVKRICLKTNMAKRANKNSYEVYKNELKKALDKNSVPYENIEHFLSENVAKIVCLNRKPIKVRESTSIFKHAIDTTNYRFVRDALFIDVNGKKRCNPNIDFSKTELINGKQESLLDFLEKLSNDSTVIGFHTVSSLNDLKVSIELCINENS